MAIATPLGGNCNWVASSDIVEACVSCCLLLMLIFIFLSSDGITRVRFYGYFLSFGTCLSTPNIFFALQKYGFYFNLTKKTGTFFMEKTGKISP
jgi:hypothetical protein